MDHAHFETLHNSCLSFANEQKYLNFQSHHYNATTALYGREPKTLERIQEIIICEYDVLMHS